MGWTLGKLSDLHLNRSCWIALVTALGGFSPVNAIGQVRGKLPDRGVYQPPRLEAGILVEAEPNALPTPPPDRVEIATEEEPRVETGLAELVREPVAISTSGKKPRPLVEVVIEDPLGDALRERERARAVATGPGPVDSRIGQASVASTAAGRAAGDGRLQQVSHEDVVLVPPRPPADVESHPASPSVGRLAAYSDHLIASPVLHHDTTCDGCDQCDSLGCDSIGCGIFGCDACGDYCDTLGCDSMGCDHYAVPWYRRWGNASLSFHRDRWFGGIEYLMMWQRGDRLPALVTTGPSTNPDTAGELGQSSTVVLVGQDRIMERLGSGGRVTIGTWLDERQCLSLVGRGWYGGRKSYQYDQNQDQTSVLARPFFNVSDGQTPAQDTQLVAFPNRASGAIQVDSYSETFGGDVSIRQFLYGDLGATVDFLYGYQFMRLNGGLGIRSNSTSLNEDFAPVGSTLFVEDTFDVTNEFHGGQIGLATNYREGCWSFNGLLKFGFGSLSRRALRNGVTITTVDDAVAVDNNGLLVRSTNTGTFSNGTFAWVPELDLSLGWQRFKGWDLTFGYQVIALTDALQPSGAIDPGLAVNLSDPPTGAQRPTSGLQYRTFYVHGIHFGIQHVY